MDSTTFMGLFIGAVLALLGGAGVIAKIVVGPVIKLNNNITTLQNKIDAQNEVNEKQDERIKKHGEEIDIINRDLKSFEGRMSKVESKLEAKKRP